MSEKLKCIDGERMKTKNYLTSNSKLAKDGILAWSIPAYKSQSGFITCPMAGICKTGCYARQGFFVMPSTQKALEDRLTLSKSAEFVSVLSAEIARRQPKRVRIHASGDFYSRKYLWQWLEIIRQNHSTEFYAYTKMIPLFESHALPFGALPDNFKVIYSFGGKMDDRIDTSKDRHSRVFSSVTELKRAGYSDAHKRDTGALASNHRVGLVYHGAKSKAWSA
jgi:hypothetical protein